MATDIAESLTSILRLMGSTATIVEDKDTTFLVPTPGTTPVAPGQPTIETPTYPNKVYIVSTNITDNSTISHSNDDVIGGRWGLNTEDIDDLNNKLSINGPLLIDPATGDLGWSLISGDVTFLDVYSWIAWHANDPTTSRRIESLSLDLVSGNTINATFRTTAPFDMPNIVIKRNTQIDEVATNVLEGAVTRKLKNSDIKAPDNMIITGCKVETQFSWSPIKTIATLQTGTDAPDKANCIFIDYPDSTETVAYYENASFIGGDYLSEVLQRFTGSNAAVYTPFSGPVAPFHVLQQIACNMSIELLVPTSVSTQIQAKWLAGTFSELPVNLKLPNDKSLIEAVCFPDGSNEYANTLFNMLKMSALQNPSWRIASLTTTAAGKQLTKYSVTLNSTFRA